VKKIFLFVRRRVYFFVIIILALLFVLSFAIFRYVSSQSKDSNSTSEGVIAANSSKTINDKAEWEEGTLTTVDSTSMAGSIKIDFSESQYDLTSIPSENIAIGGSPSIGKDNATNGNTSDYWQFESKVGDENAYLIIDLGEEISASRINLYSTCPVFEYDCNMYSSTDNITYTSLGNSSGAYSGGTFFSGSRTFRYIKATAAVVVSYEGYDSYARLNEILVYQTPNFATHTSAATQITHNDLYQWQTFTPTYTAPANTTVSFRLRTSTDSSNWTDWTAYQTPASAEALDISSLVTASTGDAGSETFYKYIQVETKLTSSDGVSTPTVDSYSIGYHTNVPPNKPTGATATVGN